MGRHASLTWFTRLFTRSQAALMFGWSAVQLLSATLLFRSVRGALCLSEWGILRPFSTPAPEKVCCGSSSSESSWRERQTGEAAGSRTFEAQALESIRGNVFSLIRAFQWREGFDRRELGSPLLWKVAQLERRERIVESPGRHWTPVCRRRANDVNPRGRFSGKSAGAAWQSPQRRHKAAIYFENVATSPAQKTLSDRQVLGLGRSTLLVRTLSPSSSGT